MWTASIDGLLSRWTSVALQADYAVIDWRFSGVPAIQDAFVKYVQQPTTEGVHYWLFLSGMPAHAAKVNSSVQ